MDKTMSVLLSPQPLLSPKTREKKMLIPDDQKIIILHETKLEDFELTKLYKQTVDIAHMNRFILELGHDITSIMLKCRILTIDMNEFRKFWQMNAGLVPAEVKVIYKHRPGVHIDDLEAVKKAAHADIVIKHLPDSNLNSGSFIHQLLTDHISSKLISKTPTARAAAACLDFLF